jgi:Asp-tRNA(Asn)/Glu-tRNA(Gln) amidotransferase A subunit family amidase
MGAADRLLAGPGDLSATEAVRAVASGERTVSEVAVAALARVAEVEEEVMAFCSFDAAAIERRAKELDAAAGAGAGGAGGAGGGAAGAGGGGVMRGVLVGVKDVIDTADAPTGYGSPLFSGHQPVADAACVATLRASGALVFGKTESTEFAMYEPTRTRNPNDTGRTPGGSSSGSAAAVAAGVVSVALGTQTAGSVVRPGAYCGVYGMKPSRGWTSTEGVFLLAQSLDTLGLFSRRAADLALVYRALRAPGFSQARRVRPARIGTAAGTAAVLRAAEWGEADGDVHDALDEVARRLERAGWAVSELRMPDVWRRLPEVQMGLMAVEVASNMRAALGERVELISANARAIVERGDSTSGPAYLEAHREAAEARRVLPALEESFDLLLAPSALGVAPEGLTFTGDPVMCRPWTLLGLPSSNVPAVRRSDGLPVGVQAVSPAYDDMSFLEDLVSIEAPVMERE